MWPLAQVPTRRALRRRHELVPRHVAVHSLPALHTIQPAAQWGSPVPPLQERLLAGGVAGAVSRTAVAPLERLRTIMMADPAASRLGPVLRAMWADGPRGLFRGNLATVGGGAGVGRRRAGPALASCRIGGGVLGCLATQRSIPRTSSPLVEGQHAGWDGGWHYWLVAAAVATPGSLRCFECGAPNAVPCRL